MLDCGFWGIMTSQICAADTTESVASACADFVVQLIERALVAENNLTGLFKNQALCSRGENGVAKGLVDLVCRGLKHPAWQRAQCQRVLLALLEKSQEATLMVPSGEGNMYMPPVMVKVPNPLHFLHSKLAHLLRPRIADVCLALVGRAPGDGDARRVEKENGAVTKMQFSSYSVHEPFGAHRLSALRLVHQLCCGDENDLSAVLLIPRDAWRVLVLWFFEYKHNNFFQSLFKQLFVAVLRASESDDEMIKFIMSDCKMLTKMIRFFEAANQPACACKGFVLEICNHLRLTTQLYQHHNQHFIVGYLRGHTAWTDFLPTLEAETKKQVTATVAVPSLGMRQDISVYSNLADKSKDQGAPESDSIDLGSTFASSMGYPQSEPLPPPAKCQSKDRKGSSASTSSKASAPGTSPAGSSSGKKKRKKKKKGKSASVDGGQGANASENDDEQ